MLPYPQSKKSEWNWLCIVMLVQAMCWILVPVLTNDAPPLDVVENTAWGTEHVIATYKNPGLSYALLEAGRLLTGGIGWPAYVLSQMAICATYLMVFLLGRSVLGPQRALVGTMLLTACYYFGWHTPEFNQDIIEIPLWAGVCFTLWRAVESNKISYWIGLGVFAAAGLYGKLSAGVLLIAAGLWLLADRQARRALATPGPWIALLIFALVFAPLGRWLANGGLDTITAYAVGRGKEKFSGWQFILLQAAVVLPMLGVAHWSGAVSRPAWPQAEDATDTLPRFAAYLLWMTIGPVLIAVAAITIKETGAKLMWGVPMLNLTGLLIVTLTMRTIDARAMRRLFFAAIALPIANATAVALTTRYGNQFRPVPDRQNWPHLAICSKLRDIWLKETGSPLKIVAGESQNWVSGLIALSHEGVASVFTLANPRLSPWITPERVAREGVLVVWPGQGPPPPELALVTGDRAPRYETFALRHPGLARDVVVGYIVVPPQSAGIPAASN